MFDLQGHFVDTKPFFKDILEPLRQRNAKFVLYSLAFIAEMCADESDGSKGMQHSGQVAGSDCLDLSKQVMDATNEGTFTLSSYLYDHRE